jgi:FkbM family methyltransferase
MNWMADTKPLADWINRRLRPFGLRVCRITSRPLEEATEKTIGNEDQTGFPPETWVMVESPDGMRLWVDLGDIGVSRRCMTGNYELEETHFVRNFLRPGQTFVDAGANIGWFSMVAAMAVGPEGKVFAFEPRHSTFHYLMKSIADNGFDDRARAYNCALGAEPGTLQIAWATGTTNPGGTWLVANESVKEVLPATTHTHQDIEVRRLDDIAEIGHVDLIKIDVEGAEPLALRGAEQLLRRSRPVVLSEINQELLKIVGGSSGSSLIRWMEALNYRCHSLGDNGLGTLLAGEAVDQEASPINVVFVPGESTLF